MCAISTTRHHAQAKLRKVEAAWEVYELKRKQAEAELLMKARERERAQAEAEARARAVREAQEAAAREAAAKQAAVLAKHKQERAVTAVRRRCFCTCRYMHDGCMDASILVASVDCI